MGEQTEKFFVGSGGWIRLNARCPQVSYLSDFQLANQIKSLKKEMRKRSAALPAQILHHHDGRVALYASGATSSEQSGDALSSLDSSSGAVVSCPAFDPSVREQVVIIGAGPAGLAAALYAARAGLCPLLIAPLGAVGAVGGAGAVGGGGSPSSIGMEGIASPAPGPGQLLAKGVDVENYPGFEAATGAALVTDMRAQTRVFGVRELDAWVSDIKRVVAPDSVGAGVEDLHFMVDFVERTAWSTSTNNQTSALTGDLHRGLSTAAIILATGAETRWLGVPGEQELRGFGVSACAACDGFLFRNKACAVIGGGDSALEEAIFLARICKSVEIFHRRDSFRASAILQAKLQKWVQQGKVTIRWNKRVLEFVSTNNPTNGPPGSAGRAGSNKLTGLKVVDTGPTAGTMPWLFETDAAFVAIGHDPNTGLVAGLGPEYRSGQFLKIGTAGSHQTAVSNVDGLFAAGDVADPLYRQAVTSAGSGAMAAMDVEKWLSGRGV